MNTKNVVITALLLSLGLAISAQAQAPIPGEANLLVWLKADDGVQNSGNTGACEVGSPTGDWLDKSGNGADAVHFAGTMELQTANFGDPAADHNVVRFFGDGSYQFGGPDPNTLLKDVISIFVVIETGKPDDQGDFYRNGYFSTFNCGLGCGGITCDLYSGGRLQSFTGSPTSGPHACIPNTDYVAPNDAPGVGDPGAGYHIICTRLDVSHTFKSIDLDGQTMGETTSMACLSHQFGTRAYLGARMGTDSPIDTNIAEFICYNDSGRETRDRIETYLSEKYGIPLVAKVCGDQGYHAFDFDKNCVVDLEDFATGAATWLQCTDPAVPGCGYVELGEL